MRETRIIPEKTCHSSVVDIERQSEEERDIYPFYFVYILRTFPIFLPGNNCSVQKELCR